MARPPESTELRQARKELARAQARVNELEGQAHPQRAKALWRMLTFTSGLPFFFIGLGLSSLLVYLGESAAAKNHPDHLVAFPGRPVFLLVSSSLGVLWFLWLARQNPHLKAVPKHLPELRPVVLGGIGGGFLLGLMLPVVLEFLL